MSCEVDEDDKYSTELSSQALDALKDFLSDQKGLQTYEAAGSTAAGKPSACDPDRISSDSPIIMPKEDWQLSQFWYSQETAQKLSEEALAAAGKGGRIACISCPTLFTKLLSVKAESTIAVLFEFDRRFSSFGESFQFYDYKEPTKIDIKFKDYFDVVIADPPFLSEECLLKTSLSTKFLTRGKIILCTGAVMEELAGKLLKVKVCKYQPTHAHNLANQFQCFTNYDATCL